MNWYFATNVGGRAYGFNDSGIETFKGNFFRYLARELIQNSLDARHDPNKPVVLRFEREMLSASELPDATGLALIIKRCKEYWPKDKKANKFFEKGLACLSQKSIACLKIGDYNTTGVRGSDTDRESGWFSFVRCSGSSPKGEGAGGSYGIGKNAPFAASDLRSVLYSTKNTDGEAAFQGVAVLAAHQHSSGVQAQSVGFLGGVDGASVRLTGDIPAKFLREKLGTDIWILGFHQDDEWKSELVFSVLENFWPAIHFRDLEVYVDKQKISFQNLESLLQEYSSKDGFSAHQYYRAFTSHTKHVPRDLPSLDRVDLYLLVGDPDLPKRIAMVRSSGMVIETRIVRSTMPYCGVFLCRSKKGNDKLREMEPPRHDVWDPNYPEKGENKKTESEFVTFLRECVKELAPIDDSKAIVIPGLSKFLPDDDDVPDESFGGAGGDAVGVEGADRRARPQTLEGKKIDLKRRHPQPDHAKPQDGDDESEIEGVEAGGGADGAGGPVVASGGGATGVSAGPTSAGPGGHGSKQSIPINFRTFATNIAAGVYVAVIAAKVPLSKSAVLRVHEIGDDGSKVPANIKEARLTDGTTLPVSANSVGPVNISNTNNLRLELVLATPARVSMGVDAHEA